MYSYMIELIEQYSNQIAMIVTAIIPALTALAALLAIVRNTRGSEKRILAQATAMAKETTHIKRLVSTVNDYGHKIEEYSKRVGALENNISSLTQEIAYLRAERSKNVENNTL